MELNTNLPTKLAKLELDPVKLKLRQYLDQFASAVRSGEFVVQRKLSNVSFPGLKVIETGKLLKFPLQEDEVSLDEIAGSDFEILAGDEWVKLEASIVDQVASGFGFLDNRISISLKQLIIQKPGNTFPTNLDALFNRFVDDQGWHMTKCFGHLVIQLPSHYSGGHIRFEHEGQLKEFDMSASVDSKEGWTTQYLAFYPQLGQNHGEILSGVRSCLIYNLEIEPSTSTPIKLPPRAPTVNTILPSFTEIILEWRWKNRSDKTADLLPLVYNTSGINPTVLATFLAPTLPDNGVTLFHGTIDALSDFDNSVDQEVVTKLKVLASPDGQVVKAFANFLRDEQIKSGDDIINDDDGGLKFDVARLEIEPGSTFRSDKFLFFLSDFDNKNVDIFKNERWIKNARFWRFHSYLCVEKYPDFAQKTTSRLELFQASESHASLGEQLQNLFPNLSHFKNFLDTVVLLEDTALLSKLLRMCTSFHGYFDTLFPTFFKSAVPWPALKAHLQSIFDPDVTCVYEFFVRVHKFTCHIQTVFCERDKNSEEFYFDVFDSMLRKFQEFKAVVEFVENMDVDLVMNFFRISEIMQYNLFKFMKSLRATFVRKVIGDRSKVGAMMGVTRVRLITDIYCCTNLLEKWPNEEVGKIPREVLFLANFFQLAEKVRADVKGVLGNVKKYGVIVRALSRVANNNRNQSGAKVRVLSKFWIPFATRLEARIEAVMYPDVDTTRPESANFCFQEGTEMLQDIRKLLESARQQ